MTTYPQSVEDRLSTIVEIMNNIEYHYPLYEECIRETFGPVLFEQWLKGSELELEIDQFEQLIKYAIASSIVKEMKDEGLVDTIENENGEDVIFLTSLGKDAARLLNTIQNN